MDDHRHQLTDDGKRRIMPVLDHDHGKILEASVAGVRERTTLDAGHFHELGDAAETGYPRLTERLS